MASAGERVQKLSAEAFSRLRNDHEQFLEAYEKPTQIYRFLHARHSFKSLFMHRNLAYMQRRKERRRRRTNRLRIGDLLKYRKHRQVEGKDLASQIKSDNFLKITFHDLEKGIDFSQLLSSALTGDVKSESPTCHTPCPMEVEVLLYSCHQHVSEGTSYPCSSISLGKFEVEYTPTENGKVSSSPGSSTSHTLTIPESKLVWRGTKNRATGSLMLVFHARASSAGHVPHQKKSQLLSSGGVNHQPQLANVSVEVNRINHSDIAQLAKARQTSFESSTAVGTSTDKQVRGPSLQSAGSSPAPSVSIGSGTGSHTKAQRKTRSSKSKERRDVCIVTDLNLGTGAASACPSQLSSTNSSTYSHSNSPNPISKDSSATPPSPPSFAPRKGFTETGASLVRKLVVAAAQPPRNGLNGLAFLNGYPEDHHHPTSKESESCHNIKGKPTPFDHKALSNCSLTVSIPCTASYQNTSLAATSSPSTTTDNSTSNNSSHQPSPPPAKRRCTIPAQKCSEIQPLLEGDKPPDQQISSFPVFIAEDPGTDRATIQRSEHASCINGACGMIPSREPLAHSTAYPVETVDSWKTLSGGAGVKRSLGESDMAVDPDTVSAAPPLKMARVCDETKLTLQE
ncbi:Polycomb protein suz12-A [Geodia barretti]|uniref:Polycomb protein suz12-A n=1 Tax=Geodia barretti TaxID=519541 RepID=A0AA35WPR2_GEOBA|nr:Polycomb protein suz12-A [Geodia barretti]